VTGEDIQDELRAIDDAARQRVLEVAQLRGAEVMIDNGNVGLGRSSNGGELLHLSAADEGCRIGFRAVLDDVTGNHGRRR